jgi:NAD-dependent SIR2 family protein deacetylase
MVQTQCQSCHRMFWETYHGARAETGESGRDLCEDCENELFEAREEVVHHELGLEEARFVLGKLEKKMGA